MISRICDRCGLHDEGTGYGPPHPNEAGSEGWQRLRPLDTGNLTYWDYCPECWAELDLPAGPYTKRGLPNHVTPWTLPENVNDLWVLLEAVMNALEIKEPQGIGISLNAGVYGIDSSTAVHWNPDDGNWIKASQ